MSDTGGALAALRKNISTWNTGPFDVAMKALDPLQDGQVIPVVMRWSRPLPHKPVPSSYATLTAAMRLAADGHAWHAQYRVEHESYVYSEEEMASLCERLVRRTLAAKERLAAAADALDVVEPFEESRLPGSYAAPSAGEGPASSADDEEAERCAVRIQAAARGRRERVRVARLRAERAAGAEQHASTVRVGTYDAAGRAAEWGDDEARAAVAIQRVARGRMARRRVRGLTSGGGTIAVRASGAATAAEKGRLGDVERVREAEAELAAAEAAAEAERAAREAAAVKIQAIARGRAARRAARSKPAPAAGKAAAIAAVEADETGSKRAERVAKGLTSGPSEAEAAVRIQAATRGMAARKQAAEARRKEAARREKEEAARREAAVRIQATARGRAARRRVGTIAATT